MKKSLLFKKLPPKTVQCLTCNHFCSPSEGKRTKCGVRENRNGILYVLNNDKIIAANIDPVEKKPLFHFLPGSLTFSIATVGCNFSCLFCQNWEISQQPKPQNPILGKKITPKQIIQAALQNNCKSIAYTYTEPTIFLELALPTMKLAKKYGLFNIWVSNGYMSLYTLDLIAPYLDAINVDLKSFSKEFYQKICGARLEPVLNNLKEIIKRKIHLEITTLIIPTLNDSEKEIKQIAQFIKKELGPEIPWHVSRFYPAYKLSNFPATPIETIYKAYEIGKKQGLYFVYTGNIPLKPLGINTESTICPRCQKIVIERLGFKIISYNINKKGKCRFCGADLNIIVN